LGGRVRVKGCLGGEGFGFGLAHLARPGALGMRGGWLGAVVRAHVLLAFESADLLRGGGRVRVGVLGQGWGFGSGVGG
jgi:hypothetical protein